MPLDPVLDSATAPEPTPPSVEQQLPPPVKPTPAVKMESAPVPPEQVATAPDPLPPLPAPPVVEQPPSGQVHIFGALL